jgi:hypothetical protein
VSSRRPAACVAAVQQSAYVGAESDVDVGLRVVEEVGGEHRQTQIGECLRHCSSFQPALCAALHVVSVTLPESAAASLTSRVSVSILLSPTTFPVRSAATSVSAQPVIWARRLVIATTYSLPIAVAVASISAAGEVDARTGLVVRGADRVARNLVRFWARPGIVLVSQPWDDGTAVLAFSERKLIGVIGLTIEDARIIKVHVHVDESTLMPLRVALCGAE